MSVALLCHFDGTSGSTTFNDTGGYHTLTASGVTVNTAAPKFGTGAGDFTSSSAAAITVGAASDFNLGAGPFTIEAFVYFTSAPGGAQTTILSQWFTTASNLGWFLGLVGGTIDFYWSTTGTDTPNIASTGFSPPLNTWFHIAVDRDASNVIRLYRDGVVAATTTSAATIFASTRPCVIGNDSGLTHNFLGRIDEARITIGVAQYGGAFTPPTAPFTNSPPPTAAGAGEADAAAVVTGAGATVSTPGIGAGEVDAGAVVTGVGATLHVAAGAGEVDAAAAVTGVGFVGAIGVGEVDAAAIVTGMGALVAPPGALPFVPGIGWSVHRRPTFDTIVAPHPSGAEVRLALWQNALWEFELSYDALASNAAYPGVWTNTLQTLMGFYLARGGQRGTFLFIDPDFNQMVGQGIGAGDGATVAFPFMRTFGGQIEPVGWVTAVNAVYLDGVATTSGWQVSGATITFASAPASGVVVSADFSYGFVCRFLEDTVDFEEFMDNLWQLKSLKFRQVRL